MHYFIPHKQIPNQPSEALLLIFSLTQPFSGLFCCLCCWLALIKIIRQKMANSYTDSLPRSINFKQTSMRDFVFESSFMHKNKENERATNYNYTNANPVGSSPFDTYNKNNLLLVSCNPDDVQVLQRNPVVYQEDIQVVSNKKPPKSKKPAEKGMAKTTGSFYPKQQKPVEQSKQAQLNEFLFNYRQQAQQKKAKKMKFLDDIESKLNNLEHEALSLEREKEKQYQELDEILHIQNQIKHEANKNSIMGKIDKAIIQSDEHHKTKFLEGRKLEEGMQLVQINAAIEDQHQCNDQLLAQIERVSRSKGKRDKVWSPGHKNSGQKQMSKTLKRTNAFPPRPTSSKKLTTTWKPKK